jgi:hypothetical protein
MTGFISVSCELLKKLLEIPQATIIGARTGHIPGTVDLFIYTGQGSAIPEGSEFQFSMEDLRDPEEWALIGAGTSPSILHTLRTMEHPSYKEWTRRGSPQGNAGVLVWGKGSLFRIEPYDQIG